MEFGAIFDWDGIIIDSSAHHKESWEVMAEEEKFNLPEDHFERSFGMKNMDIIPNLLDWAHEPSEVERLSSRKEVLYRDLIRSKGVSPLPGVLELLSALNEGGIPCAVGSSTSRENIDTIMEILGFRDFFQVIISAENVSVGKPNPDVFLKGAEGIGIEPSKCVVFEDAHVGIDAAIAGGMKVVGVATSHPVSTLDKADIAVESLTEIDLDRLKSLFA